jgi:hypothetical protein
LECIGANFMNHYVVQHGIESASVGKDLFRIDDIPIDFRSPQPVEYFDKIIERSQVGVV